MSFDVEEVLYFGEEAIKAGNKHLEIILVPAWGSNLISLVYKPTREKILRSPNSAEEFRANQILYGVPVLFPPNRIGGGTFTFRGRVYRLDVNEEDKNNHIHGFLHGERWRLVRAESGEHGPVVETRIDVDSTSHPAIYRQFPHDFSVEMSYRLNGMAVCQEATIVNHGREPFPWGFGYHTSFSFPENTSRFALTAEKRWKLNERLLPTGELEDIEYKNLLSQGMSLDGFPLDDAFLASVSADGTSEASIVLQDGTGGDGLRIRYRGDKNFKHWVVYNADGKRGFICPEPYTWVTNAPNLTLSASLTGIQVLSPGERVTVKTEMLVSIIAQS
ncbi:Aldose 1-/Glucose-6-phosphate 1-epimerase [Acididesulfobacillus acetoxydans]|uniref:Aldose 1-/Glucose-6-phosphate 1-epimerase n=1 Tax=Acididesulfobacillus acetoxydans TaxID=1561005 RepID=A0A8S0VWF2_9FIRM|nr:aldose 1-epimerase [Acididesulfobacillus acetoxydans]CAA7600803.1 Aldose 1-/Glucose-6-phosphate 1-epimerase [Acididesulfobacillus acetoxydans]CEJ08651.1 Aldose 1-epimerase [Acididesulfobacillus acetoxydans]